jgi:DNA polymerase-4
LIELPAIREAIVEMAVDTARWLSRKDLQARTVTIKVRYGDFTTITRSHTAPATRDEQEIAGRAVQLLDKTEVGRRPVRLLGVSVHNLCGDGEGTPSDWLPFSETAHHERSERC